MEKVKLKDLVDFRRKSDKAKKKYADKIKNRKPLEKSEIDNEGGGDYWITSTSCIRKAIREDNREFYDLKIDELHSKLEETELKRTKSMYQRNINILNSFKDFELDDLKPSCSLVYMKVPKFNKIVSIDTFPIYVDPSLIYTYEKDGRRLVGSIWLVAKK